MDKINEALIQGFSVAIQNSVRHARRSLLDFVDITRALSAEKADPAFFEVFKKRVHNDISMLGHQMLAATEILRTGGDIPAFGRTEDQIKADTENKSRREQAAGRYRPGG